MELDKHIRLIDSPGVVLATKDEEFDPTEMALKNSIRVEALEDPIEPIIAILRRCSVKAVRGVKLFIVNDFDIHI